VVQRNVSAAAISPGNALAFLRTDTTGKEPLSLWIASPTRNGPSQRTFAPLAAGTYSDGHLAYSRDGSKLGLWLARWSGRSDFWVLPVSGSEPKKVLDLPNFAHEFEWLPDNRTIVYGALAAGTPGADLHAADTMTGRIRRITVTPKDLTEPAVSPDGDQLAFTVANNDFDLLQVPLDGSPATKILATSRNEQDASWSPVSDQYAYSTDRTGRVQIWLRSRAGDWERPLVTEKDFGEAWIVSINETSFSWDGQRIVYAVGGDNGHSVWISSVQGGAADFRDGRSAVAVLGSRRKLDRLPRKLRWALDSEKGSARRVARAGGAAQRRAARPPQMVASRQLDRLHDRRWFDDCLRRWQRLEGGRRYLLAALRLGLRGH
jgi:Tol biopolymer transport system component